MTEAKPIHSMCVAHSHLQDEARRRNTVTTLWRDVDINGNIRWWVVPSSESPPAEAVMVATCSPDGEVTLA
jgi:hypothetical protein